MKRSKKYVCLYSLVLLIVGLGLIGQAAAVQPDKEQWPESMIIEGMSVGSSAYMVAAALGQAIKDELGIRTQVTAGVPPTIEVRKVGKGESHIGYGTGETPYDAFRGEHGWKGKQLKGLRVMSHVISTVMHFITWPGTGIDSAADLKGKALMGDQARVRFNIAATKAVLAENGLTEKDVKIITWREWGEQVSFIRMKLGDAIFMISIFWPLYWGFMVGDVGYAFATIILALIIHQKMKNESIKELTSILIYTGFVAAAFGVVYGEFFGDIPFRIFKMNNIEFYPLFDRSVSIIDYLVITLVFAYFVIFLSISLGLINGIKVNDPHMTKISLSSYAQNRYSQP